MVINFLNAQTLIIGRLLIPEIPEGSLPLQIPYLLGGNKAEKTVLLRCLRMAGVEVSYWPDLPQVVLGNREEYPVANYLKENVIHFAI